MPRETVAVFLLSCAGGALALGSLEDNAFFVNDPFALGPPLF